MTDLLLGLMTAHECAIFEYLALLAQPLVCHPNGLLVLGNRRFARQGLMDWRGIAAISLATSVAGDCAGYGWVESAARWARCHLGSRYRACGWVRDQFAA